MRLSKSQFIRGLQCTKALWLYKYRRDLRASPDAQLQAKFDAGTDVGVLAQKLFPGGVEIVFDRAKFSANITRTAELIKNGVATIYEATFLYDDVLVMADILHKGDDGWELYEVKSSTSVKPVHENDVAIQHYVLNGAGLNVSRASLVHINNQYTRQGDLDIETLFTIADLTDIAKTKKQQVVQDLVALKQAVPEGSTMPDLDIGPHCNDPYECDFKDYCWQHIPEVSVFNLSRMYGSEKFRLYYKGIISYSDLPLDYPLTPAQQMQVDAELTGTCMINRGEIQAFLETLKAPVGYMDFETFMEAVPSFNGQRPYQQIPFQFSHHVDDGSGSLQHYSFLGEPGQDPREGFIYQLLKATKDCDSIVVYNKAFECRILNELKTAFPHLREAIDDLIDRVVDLMVPFRDKSYYSKEMQGGYSIKMVLPALVPEMSYDGLVIADGSAAMDSYATLPYMTDEQEITETREALLRYCELDTLAMVKIVDRLQEL